MYAHVLILVADWSTGKKPTSAFPVALRRPTTTHPHPQVLLNRRVLAANALLALEGGRARLDVRPKGARVCSVSRTRGARFVIVFEIILVRYFRRR